MTRSELFRLVIEEVEKTGGSWLPSETATFLADRAVERILRRYPHVEYRDARFSDELAESIHQVSEGVYVIGKELYERTGISRSGDPTFVDSEVRNMIGMGKICGYWPIC